MDFKKYMDYQYKLTEEKWWSSKSSIELECTKVNYLQKKAKEMRLDKCVDKLIDHIKSFPQNYEEAGKIWAEKFHEIIENILKKDYIFSLDLPDKLKEECFKVTRQFFKKAREFDKDMSLSDIGQAMRNVWIINMIQSLKGEDVCLTNSIFSYSMLYPYTDNLIDDVKISLEEKKQFNERLTQRLKGDNLFPLYEYEAKVFALVANIEDEYARNEFSEVYESLLQIQQGQILSLSQQDKESIPYERDILGISVKKGGSSVLVDGYLVDGYLTESEIEFCIGYGVLLQIADDIQDVKEDIKNKHITIMSQLADNYKLDIIINKLMNFTIETVDNFEGNVDNPEYVDRIKKLIKDNCIMLILFSMALSKSYFTKEYVKKNEEYLPFTIKYIENLEKNLKKKFGVLNDMKESGMLDKAINAVLSL